jgi:hypothetical protein
MQVVVFWGVLRSELLVYSSTTQMASDVGIIEPLGMGGAKVVCEVH